MRDLRIIHTLLTITTPHQISQAHTILYPILLDRAFWCEKEDIFKALLSKGIGVQVHYKPVYQFSLYKNLFGEQRLKNTEDFYKAELTLPCHQEMSIKDAKFIADTLLEICKTKRVCNLIVAIIPARGGSKRDTQKKYQKLLGANPPKRLIGIETGLNSKTYLEGVNRDHWKPRESLKAPTL